ncbi:MAG TPA: TonB-dependent receptor [Flavobacteriaceae bacterium]|nr:TonB-dependent receptor [Flavobacteriaceae bacterium]
MKHVLILLAIFFCFQVAIAQKIQVLSQQTGGAIPGVALFNKDKSKSAITNFDGFADISSFNQDERITFQHIAHAALWQTKSQILTANGQVFLITDASSLDEVVLSVSKFGQKKRDIPQQIVSVTSDDVLFRNPQTAADLLQSSGQVYVQKSQLGGGSPLIRGFSTNRLLIAVDGVRFNTAIFRGGNVQNIISIDPFAVARTEVILGPGSVVYGSDAVGGVMNFYTKKPVFSFKQGTTFSGNTTLRYATANKEKTGHFDFNIGAKKWAFLTSVTYSDFDNLRMGSHGPDDYLRTQYVETLNGVDTVVQNQNPKIQRPTAYSQINTMQKVRYMPNNNWNFDLGLFYTTTTDYPRYDRLIRTSNDALRSAVWDYGPQQWFSGNLQIQNTPQTNTFFDKSAFTLSFQHFTESRSDRDFGAPFLYKTQEKVAAYTTAWDFEKKIKKAKLNYGVEYIFNKVGSRGLKTDILTGTSQQDVSRYPDGSSWQSLAGYMSTQFALAENISFLGGLRYSHIIVAAQFDTSLFALPFTEATINTGALTGTAGVTWNPNQTLGWRLNFGTAFRAPNIDDIGKVFDSEPGSVVVPNPDLKPEYAYNGDLGVSLNFENKIKLDFAGFYTILEDALIRRDFSLDGESQIVYQGELSTIQAIQNASRAQVYGFEAGLEFAFSKAVKLSSQYNITKGFAQDQQGTKQALRHAAPAYGNTHIVYKKEKLTLDVFAVYNGQFDFEDLAPSQQNNAFLYAADQNGNPYAPKWYTLNFSGQYKFSKAFQLTATLENITDQRYRPYSSGLSAPGRNLIIAATYTF